MRVLGADFARWQGKINWETTADAAITRRLPSGDIETIGKLRFVYHKATHGTTGIDPEFAHNSVGRVAMRWSGYYFWFVPGQPPRQQAEWCFKNIEKTYTSKDLCVAMDFEELAPVGYGAQRLLQEGQECGERLEELLGHKIINYSGKGFWDHPQGCAGLDSEWFASRDYWHAQYKGHVPLENELAQLAAPWLKRLIRERIWQWDGDKGIYLPNGVDSDFNFFNGSEDDMQAWVDGSGIAPTPEPGATLRSERPERSLLHRSQDRRGRREELMSIPNDSLVAFMLAYEAGYKQGRIGAETSQAEPAPPPKGYSRDQWNGLTDEQKVDTLAEYTHASDLLTNIAHMLLDDDRAIIVEPTPDARYEALRSLGSIFCMGCGAIQRINEHGYLDHCQCQNDT